MVVIRLTIIIILAALFCFPSSIFDLKSIKLPKNCLNYNNTIKAPPTNKKKDYAGTYCTVQQSRSMYQSHDYVLRIGKTGDGILCILGTNGANWYTYCRCRYCKPCVSTWCKPLWRISMSYWFEIPLVKDKYTNLFWIILWN